MSPCTPGGATSPAASGCEPCERRERTSKRAQQTAQGQRSTGAGRRPGQAWNETRPPPGTRPRTPSPRGPHTPRLQAREGSGRLGRAGPGQAGSGLPGGTPEALRGAPSPGLSGGGSLHRASRRGCVVPGVTLKSVAVLPRSVSRTWSGPGPGSRARTPPPCPTPPLGPRPQSVKASHSAAILALPPPLARLPAAEGRGHAAHARCGSAPGGGGNGRGRSAGAGRGAEWWGPLEFIVCFFLPEIRKNVGLRVLSLLLQGVGRLCQGILLKSRKAQRVLHVLVVFHARVTQIISHYFPRLL